MSASALTWHVTKSCNWCVCFHVEPYIFSQWGSERKWSCKNVNRSHQSFGSNPPTASYVTVIQCPTFILTRPRTTWHPDIYLTVFPDLCLVLLTGPPTQASQLPLRSPGPPGLYTFCPFTSLISLRSLLKYHQLGENFCLSLMAYHKKWPQCDRNNKQFGKLRNPRLRCQQIWGVVRTHFLVCRWLSSHCFHP